MKTATNATLKPVRLFGPSGYSHDDDNGFVFTSDWSGKKERQSRDAIKQETLEKHAAIVADYAKLSDIRLERDRIQLLAERYDLAPYSVSMVLKQHRKVRHLFDYDLRKVA